MASSAFLSLADLEITSRPTSYGPGASSLVKPPAQAALHRQPPLPPFYREMTAEEVDRQISAARSRLGRDLVILGHHYQRDEVVKHADFRGDSFRLSQLAAGRAEASYIVFCGVHFMAESADILSGADQAVILPNLTAGCSMADMASIDDVLVAWDAIHYDDQARTIPVTYMNSSADLKAFCGEHNGIVCTSSNAPAVLRWAYGRGERVLFFPDEHLGRNSADKIGLGQEWVEVWDPRRVAESRSSAVGKRLIVWKGFCSVHERFTLDQILKARDVHPDCLVIVHPECRREVVQAADSNGSTEHIIDQIERAPSHATIAVGTEINLVARLAAEHTDKTIFCLDPVVCPCSTMYRIHPAYLAWTLDNLLEGTVVNRITVDERAAAFARLALDRMLKVGKGSGASTTSGDPPMAPPTG